VLTGGCPLRCGYCHMEGDLRGAAHGRELTTDEWVGLLQAALRNGIRKVKLLGGEPFRRPDLERIIAAVRAAAPEVDLSVITSGVANPDRLDAAFAVSVAAVASLAPRHVRPPRRRVGPGGG
jgi:pyrroloquinoline quinone biosynthesis protein E